MAKKIADNFAGGGGASTGIERAIGRCVDVAINHDRLAIMTHSENHPKTKHLIEDVYAVDPIKAVDYQDVGLAWLAPTAPIIPRPRAENLALKRSEGLPGSFYAGRPASGRM
jgi:DNA (cytosine-5)-methyltransferase 1